MSLVTRITLMLDRERAFDLLPRLEELERIVGTPAGMIVKRVLAADFAAADCPTIVRLALIGAGETPKVAAQLAADYVTSRPLSEQHELALPIVLAAWTGVRNPVPATAEPEAPAPVAEVPSEVVLVHPGGREEILPPVPGWPTTAAPNPHFTPRPRGFGAAVGAL